MMRLALLGLVALGFVSRLTGAEPNVVVILADDLGYGDVRSLNPDGKIATPHLDKLAAAGLAVLVVTHEERVSRAASRVLRLEEGRLR